MINKLKGNIKLFRNSARKQTPKAQIPSSTIAMAANLAIHYLPTTTIDFYSIKLHLAPPLATLLPLLLLPL